MLGLTYNFIAIDLGLVEHVSDRVGRHGTLGHIVELPRQPASTKAPTSVHAGAAASIPVPGSGRRDTPVNGSFLG